MQDHAFLYDMYTMRCDQKLRWMLLPSAIQWERQGSLIWEVVRRTLVTVC